MKILTSIFAKRKAKNEHIVFFTMYNISFGDFVFIIMRLRTECVKTNFIQNQINHRRNIRNTIHFWKLFVYNFFNVQFNKNIYIF